MKQDLVDDLKSELGGKFEDAVVALMTDAAKYDASEIKSAIGVSGQGLILDVDHLPFPFILSVCCFFQDLIADLKSELSGNFEDVVIAIMAPPAQFDASQLHQAMKVSKEANGIAVLFYSLYVVVFSSFFS